MALGEGRHADEDTLERYSRGRLRGPDNDAFEEHLLVCERCQNALASMDSYLDAMRIASAEERRDPQSGKAPWIERLFQMPKLAWAFGLAAAAILILAGIGYPTLRRAPSPAVVVLEANRGAGGIDGIAAPARKPLELVLNLNGVTVLRTYRLQIVDAAGHAQFQSEVAAQDGKLQATIRKGFQAGAYFVRLYGPNQDLLREYALRIAN